MFDVVSDGQVKGYVKSGYFMVFIMQYDTWLSRALWFKY